MVYRTEIKGVEEFEKNSIGGRKVARAANKTEKLYLITLNNKLRKLYTRALEIAGEIDELGERESNLYDFIREREGLL